MRVIERPDGIRAVSAGSTVTVDLGEEWEYADASPTELGGPNFVVVERRRLVPGGDVALPTGEVSVIGADGTSRRLDRRERVPVDSTETVVTQAPIPTLCRPLSGGTVVVDETSEPTLETDGEVTLAWLKPVEVPVGPITVAEDAAGVAAAVTAASVSLPATQSPQRTWPNARAPAPLLVFDEEARDPASVDRLDTGVEVVFPAGPDALARVMGAVSLLYYLGADVSVTTDADEARLHAAGSSWSLGTDPETVDRTASEWLRRVFFLDCLARCAGPHGTRLQEADAALAHVDGDAETLFDLDFDTRVARYLVADAAVDDPLPTWPEVVHVEPSVDRVPRLSRYLGRLADVRLPRGEELTVGELAGWEPDVPVRGQSRRVPKTRVVPEAHGEAGVVGWDAPGSPVGAFDGRGEPSPRGVDDGPLRVVVARCGWQSAGETVSRWRERESALDLSVEVVSRPSVERLQELLRSGADVVHLAAHHEPDSGIECVDDYLHARDLDDVQAGVVVANCCDSERWAREAVDAGAATAVATTGPITVTAAERDGADLAGLLSLGWCVERAVGVLREVHDAAGWVTVGDGGCRVAMINPEVPPILRLDTESDEISIDYRAPEGAGRRFCDALTDTSHLSGHRRHELTEFNRTQLFETMYSPIVVDETRLDWPPYESI